MTMRERETGGTHCSQDVKRWYSQFLRRLGMEIKSVEVAKFLKSNPDEQEFRMEVRDACGSCSARGDDDPDDWAANSGKNSNCRDCWGASARRWRRCVVCRLPVRGGLVSICLHCGHGGHVAHLRHWFEAEGQRVCPAGCGCPCDEMRMNPSVGGQFGQTASA